MNLFNPCRKCILRPICQTDCDQYRKFIMLFGIMKIHMVVVACLIIPVISILISILLKVLNISINQINPYIINILLVIIPIAGYLIMAIIIDKYYKFDIRKK